MAAPAEATHKNYLSADLIPELAGARQEVREQAWAMVRQREQQQAAGEADLPLPVDALSTAEAILEAEAQVGVESVEYKERYTGLNLDCQRLVAEWFRKLKPEYFPKSRHFFNAEEDDYYSHGLSLRQMTEKALRPILDNPEEVERRVNERVEDATPGLIRKLGGFSLNQAGVRCRTISECTDKAIADYHQDHRLGRPHQGYNGYVPEIEKLMIRDITIDEATGDRLEEQMGLPGKYINHFVIQETIRRRGIETGYMDKTELHGTQLLVDDDLIEFVELLDTVAGEEWCVNVFLGEEVSEAFIKDYSNVREEALQRQAGLKGIADTVTNFVLDLARDKFDRRKAPAKIEAFVKLMLLDVSKQDISLAEQMFDAATAIGLRQVRYLETIGREQEAETLFKQVAEAAPGGGYCGAGSCGLEAVNTNSEEGKELRSKLHAGADDKIVKDTERACRCGKKSIIYAYNDKKVNKYCQSCGAFESKVSKK